jgi:hypothetical protein
VAFDVALIACPVMQFYCGTPMYLLSGVDKEMACQFGCLNGVDRASVSV